MELPLRRVNRDFGRFDYDPYGVATIETQFANRCRCDLGNDRRCALETDTHPVALEIEIDRSSLPDISRRAVGPSPIQGDGARMHHRKHLAVDGASRHQRTSAGEGNDVLACASTEEIDADEVGHVA